MYRDKAKKLTSNLHLGSGATDFVEGLISEAVDSPCKYCGEIITIENMRVDHIVPLLRSMIPKKNKKQKKVYTKEELAALYSRSNVQIICKECNIIKGSFSEEDFVWLMDVLSKREHVKKEVFKRMKAGSCVFRRF